MKDKIIAKLKELVDLLKKMLLPRPSEITSFFNELKSLESELSALEKDKGESDLKSEIAKTLKVFHEMFPISLPLTKGTAFDFLVEKLAEVCVPQSPELREELQKYTVWLRDDKDLNNGETFVDVELVDDYLNSKSEK